MDRRTFINHGLRGAGGLALAGSILPAFCPITAVCASDSNDFVFSRFKFSTLFQVHDEWDIFPHCDDAFLAYLAGVTNIKLSPLAWQDRVVRVDDFARMYTLPFLFMTSEGEFHLSPAERAALAEFFRRGGFLYADDCVTQPDGDFFYQSFIREVNLLLPKATMKPVPEDHEIYHCFYEFPGRSPLVQGKRNPDMGLFYEDRMVAFLTSGDIHCGWGGYVFQRYQESCFKMATNIVIYALTH